MFVLRGPGARDVVIWEQPISNRSNATMPELVDDAADHLMKLLERRRARECR
jgi:hypothetical protein